MTAVTSEKNNCIDSGLYVENGLYDGDNSGTVRKVSAHVWPIIRDLLSLIPFARGSGPFVICDYGTADAVNSTRLIGNCIDWIQKTYGEDQQVHVIYEDRSNNDFNSLIRSIEGGATGRHSYLANHKHVFVSCCGRNFFEQCLPDASVHLGICSMAVMWLSIWPRVLTKEVFPIHFAEGSPEQVMFQTQSARDWETFLLHRSTELAFGGRLVIATLNRTTCPCTDVKSDEWCLFDTITNIWREMAHEKIIMEEEFHAAVEPSYWQKPEQLRSLFDDDTRVKRSGLNMDALETHRLKCAWRERWMMSDKQDDISVVKDHAESFVQSIRVWCNRIFTRGLSSERTCEEQTKILDKLFSRLVDNVAVSPANRYYDYVVDFMTVSKTSVR